MQITPDHLPHSGRENELPRHLRKQINRAVERMVTRRHQRRLLFIAIPLIAIIVGIFLIQRQAPPATWVRVSVVRLIVVFAGLGLLLGMRVRFARRIHAERRDLASQFGRYPICLKCDYDVSRGDATTCPECGEPVLVVKADKL